MIDETARDDERLTWWTKWRVPAAPVILGMAILTAAIVLGFWQISDSRHDAAIAIERQACVTQAEFRGFFTAYLQSQVGTPVEDVPGFDQLSPEAKEFALSLAPVLDASRERDEQALAEYLLRFPIPDCSDL
jgi:hypothetical protein